MADTTTAKGTEGAAPAAPTPAQGAAALAQPAPAAGGTDASNASEAPIKATPDEARQFHYVRMERFGQVNEEKNRLKAENERLQAILQHTRPAAPTHAAPEEPDNDDPLAVAQAARAETAAVRREMEAREQASRIRGDIGKLVQDLGFNEPGDAAKEIEKDLFFELQSTGRMPDLTTLANARRQREIAQEAAIAARYRETKRGPAADAARPAPASPPVVASPPEKETGWKAATRRIKERMYSGGAG